MAFENSYGQADMVDVSVFQGTLADAIAKYDRFPTQGVSVLAAGLTLVTRHAEETVRAWMKP
jgi:hypothetical protein